MNQISKFTVNIPDSKDFSAGYVSQPSLSQEKLLGKLFVAVKIKNLTEDESEIAGFIVKIIENNYYNFRVPDSSPLDLNFEHIFENSLQQTNLELYRKFEETRWDEILKNLSLAAGVVKNNEICFSYFGGCQAFLVKSGKRIEIISSERPAGNQRMETLYFGGVRIFSYITNGRMEPEDTLLFSTDEVLNRLPEERLKEILSSDSPSAEQLRKLENLFNQSLKFPSAFVIIEGSSPAEKKSVEDQLIKSILHPQVAVKNKNFRPALKKSILKIFALLAAGFKKIKWSAVKNRMASVFSALKKGASLAGKTPAKISSGLAYFKKLPQQTDDSIVTGIEKFNQLPKRRRALLIVFLVAVILFVQVTFLLIWKQRKAEQAKIYEQMTQNVENLQQEGFDALIYNDENKAKELLTRAEGLIRQLPRDSKEEREKFNLLDEENRLQLNKIRRIVALDEPAVIADLAPEKYASPKGILLLDKYIYAFGDSAIYKIDLSGKEISELRKAENAGFASASIFDQNSLFFRQTNGKLSKLDMKTEAFSELKIDSRKPAENIADSLIYGQRLYFLSPADNQIFQYSKTTAGFGAETAWLKDAKIDIKDAVSFSIDGNIYALKSNGEIVKFYKGLLQGFTLDKIEPALSGSAKILTAQEMKNIYILHPAEKRVIILDKNGKLIRQYQSEKFGDLKDLAVNEAEGKIYLLSGNQIFEISTTD